MGEIEDAAQEVEMSKSSRGNEPLLCEIGEEVFAYVQPDGGWCLNNAGLIGKGDRSVLIDTAATEARARALRAAVHRVTDGFPRYVVNTHFHGDHTFGNFVFPEAIVVGHERVRSEMGQAGTHLTSLWPEVDWGNLELRLPDLTFGGDLVLQTGETRVELLHLGPAHTAGDTVVWLPDQRVLFTGDLVMSGVTPFCPMGSVAGSLAALRVLRELGPSTVVTGHGPVTGPQVFDETEAYLRWLQALAKEGVAVGLAPLQIAHATDLGPYADWLDAERLVPNLYRACAEERGEAPGGPVDMNSLFADMVEFHGRLPACNA